MNWRVATFNIRHGLGRDDRIDLERTGTVIAELACDVVALQELDRGLARSGEVDQPAELARITGLVIEFWPTLRRGNGEYGIALAARGPLSSRFEALPRKGEEEPRGVVVGRSSGLDLVGTHLSRDPGSRAAQVVALAEIAGRAGPRVVVLGDMNERQPGLRALRAAGMTTRSARPAAASLFRRPIDHVFAGPGLVVERAWTVASDASDHLPVVAEIAEPLEASGRGG